MNNIKFKQYLTIFQNNKIIHLERKLYSSLKLTLNSFEKGCKKISVWQRFKVNLGLIFAEKV